MACRNDGGMLLAPFISVMYEKLFIGRKLINGEIAGVLRHLWHYLA